MKNNGLYTLIIMFVLLLGAFVLTNKTEPEVVIDIQSQDSVTEVEIKEIEKEHKPKEWSLIASMSSSTKNQSETFALTSGEVKVKYANTEGSCYIYLMESHKTLEKNGGFPVVIAKGTPGESLTRQQAGDYYIALNTNNECGVEVYQKK